MDTTRAREQLGWEPRYTGLEALRDTLRRGPRPRRRPCGADLGAQPVEHLGGEPLGHLQLRHVADAGELEVAPGRVPPGDVAGGGDRDQPVAVAVDQQHRRR